MDPQLLLERFGAAATAVREALAPLPAASLRDRTDKPGQYALDLVADRAALAELAVPGLAIVSEESGIGGDQGGNVVAVLDPVDGSTNASRGIPYWGTSICALDAGGALAAYVVNQVTGSVFTAIRGQGAFRDGERLRSSSVSRVEDSIVAISSFPGRVLPWKQFRALGCASLALCDVAAGQLDGYVDGTSWHAPWDYLGGMLLCTEAGATVVDAGGRALDVSDPNARRQIVAGGTRALVDSLLGAAR